MTDPTPDLATPLTAEEEAALRATMRIGFPNEDNRTEFIRRLLATLDRDRIVAQEMYRRESAVSRSLAAARQPVAETALREAITAIVDSHRSHKRTAHPGECDAGAVLLEVQMALDQAALATREPDPAPLDASLVARVLADMDDVPSESPSLQYRLEAEVFTKVYARLAHSKDEP